MTKDFLLINFFIKEIKIYLKKNMDTKLFKKTYPFICNDCGEFSHTKHEYCDKCGKEDSLRKARKIDYKNHRN
ncbi:MAG TPA: hypothetical protein ENH98_01700 [archaeon]|nr:hypothetical protein [archaeon]